MGKNARAVGQKQWDSRRKCWVAWSGRRWHPAVYSGNLAATFSPEPLDSGRTVDAAERARLLEQVIGAEALNGADVVHRGPTYAVFSRLRPISHSAHLLLSIVTLGVWSIVWIALSIGRTHDRHRIDVDVHGHAWARLT